MYGTVESQVFLPPSQEAPVVPTEFKVYKRRWLYLTCICLANMSNAIVSHEIDRLLSIVFVLLCKIVMD